VNLILIGYRGSGKSTIGTLLAKRLGWRFTDLDEVIAERAGRSIAEIFAEEGEAGFRSRERDACKSLRRNKHSVVALGGGTLEDPENRALIRRAGKVVWLRAPAIVLWSRIKADPQSAAARPNLTPIGGLPEVEAKLAEREPHYRNAAHHSVDTMSATPKEIVDTVELWYRAGDAGKR
jgi:shikimate kinase